MGIWPQSGRGQQSLGLSWAPATLADHSAGFFTDMGLLWIVTFPLTYLPHLLGTTCSLALVPPVGGGREPVFFCRVALSSLPLWLPSPPSLPHGCGCPLH